MEREEFIQTNLNHQRGKRTNLRSKLAKKVKKAEKVENRGTTHVL
jgi:hypothetical protein